MAEDSKGARLMPGSPHGRTALVTGGLAAILASTCCLGPLALVALPSTPVKNASQ